MAKTDIYEWNYTTLFRVFEATGWEFDDILDVIFDEFTTEQIIEMVKEREA